MTQLLHRLTSYEAGREWDEAIADDRIVQDLVPNDPEHFPRFYKDYPADLPRIALPRELPTPHQLGDSGAGRHCRDADTDARPARPGPAAVPERRRHARAPSAAARRWFFRASGSAGARFPLELYVSVPDGARVCRPACIGTTRPSTPSCRSARHHAAASPAIVVTGVPWRTGWRYRERGFRHIYWDAGTMLAQLLALGDSAGATARLFTRFPDAAVTDLVGADGTNEFPVAVVALGPDDPALQAAGPASAGNMDADGREFPLVTAAQHAGDQDDARARDSARRRGRGRRRAGAPGRDHPAPRLDAADGRGPQHAARRGRRLHGRGHAGHRHPALARRPRRR